MKKSPKQTSVKIKPLKGKFFDIKPPKGGAKPPKSRSWKGFMSFFWMAFIIFVVLNLSNIYLRGKELATESQEYALIGYEYLNNGIQSFKDKNLENADVWFQKAEESFLEIKENTSHIIYQSNDLIDESLYLNVAKKLVDSSVLVSQMGQKAIDLIENTSEIPKMFIGGYLKEGEKITDIIKEQKIEFDELYSNVLVLQQNLTTLNSSLLPADMQEKITEGQELIGKLITPLVEFNSAFDTALLMLGDKLPHRYLILFQNNHELRATGGFLGSYMIIDINDGEITKMESKDVYETDGQLTDIIDPPPGIDQVSERWFMRDANYSPDFPTSAEKLMWFLEHSQGPSVDTVVAIDQTFVEKLLEITGPIHLEHFPFQIKADNFSQIISFYIESKMSETATPKQLLFDFIPVFKDKFLNIDRFNELIEILLDMRESRHIQAYSKDYEIQKLIEHLNISGAMPELDSETDFLAIVTTSIGGNKSDQYIKTEINHQTEVTNMGILFDYLQITKEHTWSEDDFKSWQKLIDRYGTGKANIKTLRFIQGEGENIDYMRIYVPKGSKLLKTEGIDSKDIQTSEDLDYTVFEFIFGPIESGSSHMIRLQYQLPFMLMLYPSDTYKFTARKQAGAENQTLIKGLKTPQNLIVTDNFPLSQKAFSLMPEIKVEFDKDQVFMSEIFSAF